MIRRITLTVVCLLVSCISENGTNPQSKVYQTSGNYSITYDGTTSNCTVPEGAGSCRIIGDSTMYDITVDISDSKENYAAKKSLLVFWGDIKKTKTGIISSAMSDSTFMLGYYDANGAAFNCSKGTITFTTIPSRAGDTLKGVVSGTLQNVIKYDPQTFSAQFSVVCEKFN